MVVGLLILRGRIGKNVVTGQRQMKVVLCLLYLLDRQARELAPVQIRPAMDGESQVVMMTCDYRMTRLGYRTSIW